MKKKTEQKPDKYKLPCDHRHAGVDYKKGDELELTDDQIDRIKQQEALKNG